MRTPTLQVFLAICCFLAASGCAKSKMPHASRDASAGDAPILLFNGAGTSPSDVAAIESLLNQNHLNHSTMNSSQLNSISGSQLERSRLLIVPGGNFIEIGNGLSSDATAKIRDAVHNGLSYLGICGGAFFASDYPGYNGLNLTSGVKLHFYSAEEKGIRKAAVPVTVVGEPTQDQYWEDGPQLSGWGAVIGKYPDGSPAIAEGTFGKGWVVLIGIHPEAPEKWRQGMTFATPASVDNGYAVTLIRAAMNRESLPHY